jgi:hypothetical protein
MLFRFVVGFYRSRWLAGRLTACLKGAGQARAWAKLRTHFLITYKVRTELIRMF